MKLKVVYIKHSLILLPFFLVFIAEIISFRNQSLGSILKLSATFYMFLYSLFYLKFDGKIIFILGLFIPIFLYHIFISFNFNAAIEEAIRYLFPIIVLIYGYAIRNYYLLIIYFIISYALLNNIYQPIVYINWLRDVPEQWFYYQVASNTDNYYYNSTMGIIRAVGLIGFFAAFGFLNLISYFLTRQFYIGKHKKIVLNIFVFGVFSSLSFKAIGVLMFLMFLLSKHKHKLIFWALPIFVLLTITFPQKIKGFREQLMFRVETYITEGNSARAESYRVMFEDIAEFRFLGRGVGSFGGASSTKYNSPVYDKVDFNWYDTNFLSTTDTYFPHAFVELGIIGGLLYFLIILAPLIKRRYNKQVLLILFVIYFALFFDSLFSFALNNLGYLMISLVLIYPILEYEKKIKN
jgi:hypothetical protein